MLLVLLAPVCVNAQVGFSPFRSDFPREEFAARRAKVFDAIGATAIAVVQGAPSPAGYTRFRQSNEFYYLSGIEVPHAYLLLDGGSRRALLYLPHRNAGRERGEGRMLSAEDAEEVQRLSGIDDVYGTDLLAEHLARYARGGLMRTLLTPFSPAEGSAMSRDLAPHNILVNTVCIGVIKSGQHERAWQNRGGDQSLDDFYAWMLRQRPVPLGRIGEAAEAGDLIAFLASARAAYISGVAINLDGGQSAVV